MDERTSRMMAATWNQPRAMAGSIRCFQVPLPEAGSQESSTAKIHISTMPSQNVGSDWPRSAMTLAAVSHLVPLATAASTPRTNRPSGAPAAFGSEVGPMEVDVEDETVRNVLTGAMLPAQPETGYSRVLWQAIYADQGGAFPDFAVVFRTPWFQEEE